jgi:hypothetical protein
VQCDGLRSRCDHRDAQADVGLLAKAKRTHGQHLRVRHPEYLEMRVRECDNTDLDADRYVFDHASEMLDFGAGQSSALFEFSP